MAQKLDLPHPFDVLYTFGGKSKFVAPRALKFCTKWFPIEVNNWWKFGVDISNHLWEIQNWRFFFLKVPSPWYKNNFQKLFYTAVRALWGRKIFNFEFLIVRWFEISTPNFYQLLTSTKTRFIKNLKAQGASDLDFLPKTSTSFGRGRPIFWTTPSKFGENSSLS